jgi:hypothetical protein
MLHLIKNKFFKKTLKEDQEFRSVVHDVLDNDSREYLFFNPDNYKE